MRKIVLGILVVVSLFVIFTLQRTRTTVPVSPMPIFDFIFRI
jgi:hypothetical protein